MKLIRNLINRWPLIALSLGTLVVVLWVSLTVRSIFNPTVSPSPLQPNPLASTSSPPPLPLQTTSLPAWVKTAPPLVAPSLTPQAIHPPTASPSPQTTSSPTPSILPKLSRNTPLPQARYGHLPYNENSPERLVSIGTYGEGADQRTEYLDQDAADAFAKMTAAAQSDGVQLRPISGFRTLAQQEKLFERQIKRQGSEDAAARLSAPPGYSEHHTGYALDIGDATRPALDLKFEFEQSSAYQWLTAHAKSYGFELSFPENNRQGVSFEPWHWRYVNTTRAAALFAVAHTLR